MCILYHETPYTPILFFFFFNDTATTEIYTLSLHDALPIFPATGQQLSLGAPRRLGSGERQADRADRKSTRLNSSHLVISYAVFCLKKKKTPSSPATTLSHIDISRWPRPLTYTTTPTHTLSS